MPFRLRGDEEQAVSDEFRRVITPYVDNGDITKDERNKIAEHVLFKVRCFHSVRTPTSSHSRGTRARRQTLDEMEHEHVRELDQIRKVNLKTMVISGYGRTMHMTSLTQPPMRCVCRSRRGSRGFTTSAPKVAATIASSREIVSSCCVLCIYYND